MAVKRTQEENDSLNDMLDLDGNPETTATDEEVEEVEERSTDAYARFSIDDPLDSVDLEDELENAEEEGLDDELDDTVFAEDEEVDESLASEEEEFEEDEEDLDLNPELQRLQSENATLNQRLTALEQGKEQKKNTAKLDELSASIKTLQGRLKDAFDDGESETIATVQSEMAEALIEKRMLEREKDSPTVEAPPTPPAAPPMPALAQRFSKLNPWINDPVHADKRELLLAIDKGVASEGHSPNSLKYYKILAQRLNAIHPKLFKLQKGATQKVKRRKRKAPAKTNQARSAMAKKQTSSAERRQNTPRKNRPLTRSEAVNMRRFGLDPHNKAERGEYIRNRDAEERKARKQGEYRY